jgi:DNA-binding NtrC family response regulator
LSGTLLEATRRVTTEVERRKIAQAMQDAAGNKQRAAEALQISYKALTSKLREFGIGDS